MFSSNDFLSSGSFSLLTYRAIEKRTPSDSQDRLFSKVMETLTCEEKKEIVADWFAEVRKEEPSIRGENGELFLEGDSIEEVASKTGMTLAEVTKKTVDFFDESTTAESLSPYWADYFLTEAVLWVVQLALDAPY